MRLCSAATLIALACSAAPASASFHIMKVHEVYAGAAGSQYIELEMAASSQNFLSGHAVKVYDAAGAVVDTLTFTGSVANGSSGSKVLLATAQAVTDFGVAADLTMPTASIPSAGGMVCWETYDCVAWGNFTGAAPSPVGAPFNPSTGLPGNMAIRRSQDTDVSSADFTAVAAAPLNNGGTPVDMAGAPVDMAGSPPADMAGSPPADMSQGGGGKSGCALAGHGAGSTGGWWMAAAILLLALSRRRARA